jgi:hypothetical protein
MSLVVNELLHVGLDVVGTAATSEEMRELVLTVPFHVAVLDSLAGNTDDPVGCVSACGCASSLPTPAC